MVALDDLENILSLEMVQVGEYCSASAEVWPFPGVYMEEEGFDTELEAWPLLFKDKRLP